MKELHAIFIDVPPGGCVGPMPWARYPHGVELVSIDLSCDDKGAALRVVVECEPEVGKEQGWTPAKL